MVDVKNYHETTPARLLTQIPRQSRASAPHLRTSRAVSRPDQGYPWTISISAAVQRRKINPTR